MYFHGTHSPFSGGVGMIFYNGQKKSTGADFVSLGLVSGRLEFRSGLGSAFNNITNDKDVMRVVYNYNTRNVFYPRFDVGSGMATIRDPNTIKLGEFHTVEVHRNLTQGYIIVDGGEPISGSSQVLQCYLYQNYYI